MDEEAHRLQAIKDTLSPSALSEIIDKAKRLQEAQATEDSEEAKKCLPQLALSDIDRKPKDIPIDAQRLVTGETILKHDLPSNNILYADIAFDFSGRIFQSLRYRIIGTAGISPEDLPLLRLFARMLTGSGTASMDETELERRIGINTGGIGASYHTDIK